MGDATVASSFASSHLSHPFTLLKDIVVKKLVPHFSPPHHHHPHPSYVTTSRQDGMICYYLHAHHSI